MFPKMRLSILCICPILSAQSLLVDVLQHDFCRVQSNSKITHVFRITNGGDKDLVIASVHASCGCTSTMLGKSTLAPGDSTSLEATIDTGNVHGRVEKVIRVISNDTKNPAMNLSLAAEIVRELYVEPSAAMFFETERQRTRELSLRLISDLGPVKVDSLDAASMPYLSADVRVEGEVPFLDLRFDPQKVLQGQTQGNGRFLVKTSQPNNGKLLVPVVWSLARIFIITPDRIGARMAAGEEQRVALRVRRADGKSFRILGALSEAVTSNAPNLKIELPKKAEGKTLGMTVHILAGHTPGLYRENLFIKTDDLEEPRLTVHVNILVESPLSKDAETASKNGE